LFGIEDCVGAKGEYIEGKSSEVLAVGDVSRGKALDGDSCIWLK
jgi:hypothetical protein